MKKGIRFTSCLLLCTSLLLTSIQALGGLSKNESAIINLLEEGFIVNKERVFLDSGYVNATKNYFMRDDVDVNDVQTEIISNQIIAAKQVLIDHQITNLNTIPKQYQDEILGYMQVAANEMGLMLIVDTTSKTIIIKDAHGQMIFTASKVIKNTGDDYTTTLAYSGGIAILLACIILLAARKGLFDRTKDAKEGTLAA